jgi:hypothetical protein
LYNRYKDDNDAFKEQAKALNAITAFLMTTISPAIERQLVIDLKGQFQAFSASAIDRWKALYKRYGTPTPMQLHTIHDEVARANFTYVDPLSMGQFLGHLEFSFLLLTEHETPINPARQVDLLRQAIVGSHCYREPSFQIFRSCIEAFDREFTTLGPARTLEALQTRLLHANDSLTEYDQRALALKPAGASSGASGIPHAAAPAPLQTPRQKKGTEPTTVCSMHRHSTHTDAQCHKQHPQLRPAAN